MGTRADADGDVTARLDELQRTLDDLRADLRPRRGPLGLPRPPTPGEVLRFTEEYTIPTALAVLEAQQRALELLAEALRRTDRSSSPPAAAGPRVERLGDALLNRMDEALAGVQRAIDEGTLPNDPAARRLVREARELNADLRADVARADRDRRRPGEEPDAHDEWSDRSRGRGVNIDVEEELRTLKDDADQTDTNR